MYNFHSTAQHSTAQHSTYSCLFFSFKNKFCVFITALTFLFSAISSAYAADYIIKIPDTLTVNNSGLNATDGISADCTANDFETNKKLVITASSSNNFALKSGGNSISYTMNKTSWDFLPAELNKTNGASKELNINVEDYSNKPAGNYTDTVTFTAKVETKLAGVTLTDGIGVVLKYNLSGTNTLYFKYVAASDTFVPDYANYDEACGSKYPGSHSGAIVDQNWNGGSNNFYFRNNGNTARVYGNDGINMSVFDIQLDFDNMTYTQSYKEWYNTASGSFTSIKIGDTTINASQMTAQ